MHGVMFRRRHGFQIARIVALQTFDKSNTQARGEIRILTVGFLATAPARIAEDIDIGRPHRQAGKPVGTAETMLLGVMLSAKLRADHLRDLMHQRLIPRGGHADRLGKYRGITQRRHAVQPLVPPVVFAHAQARNGGRVVDQLWDFFVQCHAADQILGALLETQ